MTRSDSNRLDRFSMLRLEKKKVTRREMAGYHILYRIHDDLKTVGDKQDFVRQYPEIAGLVYKEIDDPELGKALIEYCHSHPDQEKRLGGNHIADLFLLRMEEAPDDDNLVALLGMNTVRELAPVEKRGREYDLETVQEGQLENVESYIEAIRAQWVVG